METTLSLYKSINVASFICSKQVLLQGHHHIWGFLGIQNLKTTVRITNFLAIFSLLAIFSILFTVYKPLKIVVTQKLGMNMSSPNSLQGMLSAISGIYRNALTFKVIN